VRFINLLGIVWLVLALGTFGYFVGLEISMLSQLRQDGFPASPAQVKHLISAPAPSR